MVEFHFSLPGIAACQCPGTETPLATPSDPGVAQEFIPNASIGPNSRETASLRDGKAGILLSPGCFIEPYWKMNTPIFILAASSSEIREARDSRQSAPPVDVKAEA